MEQHPSSDMEQHPYSQELVAAVQKLIDDTDLTPNVKWGMIKDLLKRENILYQLEQVSVDSFLVHQCNRGKLGINAFEAHKHGHNMKSVGGCSARRNNKK